MKEMLKRAARTFLQTAIGYITANLVCDISGITDLGVLKSTVIGLVISSIAAGLAAVMNMPRGSGDKAPIPLSEEDGDEEDER